MLVALLRPARSVPPAVKIADGEQMKNFLAKHSDVVDLTGRMSLTDFIAFINACNGLVAASTGPLHVAAALGKNVIGLFAPMKPIHPSRWAPVGVKASYLVIDKNCNTCRKSLDCACIRSITPHQVAAKILAFTT